MADEESAEFQAPARRQVECRKGSEGRDPAVERENLDL